MQFVADRGGILLLLTCAVLAGVAYACRRSAYRRQLDRSRSEYMSSFQQRIAFGHTFALDDDDCTRPLREAIRRLENEFIGLSSSRPQDAEELDKLYDARSEAMEELVALELERRISHVDIYGEEILNGPQDHRRGYLRYLLHSRFGSRHLTRALGIPGRAMFASGLSFIFVFVLLISPEQGRLSPEANTQEAALVPHGLRTSLWVPDLALWPPATAVNATAAADADQVVPQSVDSLPEVQPLGPHDEPSGALPASALQPDALARHHPEGLRRAQRALVGKDPFAASLLLLELGRISEARSALRRLADSGYHDAALALGSTFDPMAIGQSGPKGRDSDPERAVYWYRKAHRLDR